MESFEEKKQKTELTTQEIRKMLKSQIQILADTNKKISEAGNFANDQKQQEQFRNNFILQVEAVNKLLQIAFM